jgi:hypothetical protein
MPIKIRRAGVLREDGIVDVIVVSREVDDVEAKPEPAFRVGPAKGDAEVISVPLR